MTRPEPVQWGDLRSNQFPHGASHDAIAILPVGSTEQHGPHLPVQVDTLLAFEIAKLAAASPHLPMSVQVLPALWISMAEHHMEMPGSLTLDLATLHAFLRCVVRSLQRQGYTRVLVLNGHGGNISALVAVTDAISVELDIAVVSVTYWLAAAETFATILEAQANLLHACEAETSMVMHLRPDLVDGKAALASTAPATGFLGRAGSHRWRPISHWSCNGVVGVPALATATKGEKLLNAAAAAVADCLSDTSLWSR
jgi:creatinine amidohydrolase